MVTAVWPVLRYADAPAAIRFLVEAFGFQEAAVFASSAKEEGGSGEDFIDHAQLNWPKGGGIMLGSGRPGGVLANYPTGVGAVYLVTDQPDELYARATAAGALVVTAPKDQHFGSRDFTVKDPEGVIWTFGTYAGE